MATISNGTTSYMVYDAGGKLVAEYGQAASSTSGTSYVFADHQGSTRVAMNQSGGVISRHDYQAFGEEINAGIGQRTTTQGYDQADSVRQKYAGMEKDEATGMSHTLWRKYDSQSGRWTNPDPYTGSMTIADPQSFNRYSYVNNDPVNLTDSSGLSPDGGCSAEFSYSQCGGDAGFWGGSSSGSGFGDHVANYNREYGGMPASVVAGLRTYNERVSNAIGGNGFRTNAEILRDLAFNIYYVIYDDSSIDTWFGINVNVGDSSMTAYPVILGSPVRSGREILFDSSGVLRNITGHIVGERGIDMHPAFDPVWLVAGAFASPIVGGMDAALTETALARTLTTHAAERLAGREAHVTMKMIQTALNKGQRFYDPRNGTINYILRGGFASGRDLLIGRNPFTREITTIITGRNLIRPRMVPLQ